MIRWDSSEVNGKLKYKRSLKFSLLAFCVIGFISIIASPILLVFAPEKERYYAYRQLFFTFLAHKISGNASSKEEAFINLFDYVSMNVTVVENSPDFAGYKPNYAGPIVDIFFGHGWCDQQSTVLMTLLDKLDINARQRDVTGHTTMEVFLDGKWRIADPFFDILIYETGTNKLASLDDFLNGYGTKTISQKLEALKKYMKVDVSTIQKIFTPSEPRWKNGIGPPYRQHVKKGIIQNTIATITDTGYRIFGDTYAHLFQDIYLYRMWEVIDQGSRIIYNYDKFYVLSDEAFSLYLKARMYHMFQRYTKAIKFYKEVQQSYPTTRWQKESDYYKGLALFEQGRYDDAIEELTNNSGIALNKNHSKASYAAHIVGLSYEKLKKTNKALTYYKLSKKFRPGHKKIALKDLYRLEKTIHKDNEGDDQSFPMHTSAGNYIN